MGLVVKFLVQRVLENSHKFIPNYIVIFVNNNPEVAFFLILGTYNVYVCFFVGVGSMDVSAVAP